MVHSDCDKREVNMNSPKRKESGFLGNAAFALLLLSQTVVVALADGLFFPQFAQGETSTGFYVTELALQNRTNTAETVDIFFRDDNGMDLSIDLGDGRSGSQFQVLLAPGASTLLTSVGTGPLKVGWVHIIGRPSSPNAWELRLAGVLTGVLTFRYYENNVLKTEVAVQPSIPSPVFMIPVEYSDTSNTGVAIAGAYNFLHLALGFGSRGYCCARLNLALILLDQNGSIVATKKIFDLVGYSHMARFVNEFFPDLPSPFRGTLVIAAGGPSETAPIPYLTWPNYAVVVGLKLKDGLLSSIPAAPKFYLPVLTRIAEVEGNDTFESAQPIPLIPFTLEAAFNTVTYGSWDSDHFTVALEKDDLLVGVMDASGSFESPLTLIQSPNDGVHNPQNQWVYTYIGSGGFGARTIVFRAPSSGQHTLRFRPSKGTYRFTAIRIR